MNGNSRTSGSGRFLPAVLSLGLLLGLVSCQSGEKARQWHTADSTAVVAGADTAGGWQFEAVVYLQERLSLLEKEEPTAAWERIPREFRKVINGWVSDGLAEEFWKRVRRDHNVVAVPLVLEIGHPDDEPVYICRAIVQDSNGVFLVRSNIFGTKPPFELLYSDLSQAEYDGIISDLFQRYRAFDLESDLSHLGENTPMMVVELKAGDRRKLLLYSYYRRAQSDTARAMFEYLDSLFWGD